MVRNCGCLWSDIFSQILRFIISRACKLCLKQVCDEWYKSRKESGYVDGQWYHSGSQWLCVSEQHYFLPLPLWFNITRGIQKPVPVAARSNGRYSAARLLRLWVRIPPGAWMFVWCECRVLSGRGLCDGLITRPEESYRLWRVVVCDQETSKTRRLKPATGLWKYE